MVNKVTLFDSRTSFTGNCGSGANKIGQYYRKTQFGPDSPALPRRKKGQPRRKFNHGLANEHNYDMTVEHWQDFGIQWRRKTDPPGTLKSGVLEGCGFAPEFPPPAVFDSNANNELISKLYSKVAGSDFNLAVTLAQTGQTLDLITDGATRIYRALKALRKGNIPLLAATLGVPVKGTSKSGGPKRASTNLTQTWLEYQYGWYPILLDVHDAAKLLADQLYMPQVKVYRVRDQRSSSISRSALGLVLYKNNSTHTIRKQIVYKVSEGTEISNATLSGFTSPSLVAWELLPYSFVVDWFYPIGSYLEARSQLSALTGKFITTTTERTFRKGPVFPASGSTIQVILGSEQFLHTKLTLTRTVGPPSVKPPNLIPFGEAISWKRAVSALSLLNNLNLKI